MQTLRVTPRYLSLATQPARTSCISLASRSGAALSSRTYALSRFDGPRPGVGRERPKLASRLPPGSRAHNVEDVGPSLSCEDTPSAEQSSLWQESVRSPASNPEEGLKRLLMENDRLVVTRQIEMLSIFVGFEQTNRYVITNEAGGTLGYIAEEPRGFLSAFSRQIFRTHRPFRAVVMDSAGSPILWIRRPFAFINSRMYVQRLKNFNEYTSEGDPVLDTFAEVQQRWHFWRRRYDLFLKQDSRRVLSLVDEPQPEPEPDMFHQFARIDDGFLAWHFTLRDASGQSIANVNRTFRGFGRELFTDTGRYFVNFAGKEPEEEYDPINTTPKTTLLRNLGVEERALILATAVNIDFDYFSRHSGGGSGGFFLLESVE